MKFNLFSYKKFWGLFLLCALIASHVLSAPKNNSAASAESIKELRKKAWENYKKTSIAKAKAEIDRGYIRYGEAVMRFTVKKIGGSSTKGKPLYIALHGGGSSDTPDLNDGQWKEMQSYYSINLDEGVYIAVRGVRDTWDTHFNPESYPLYDKLIQDCILVFDIDPNKVYLEGFSAGGDGVYAVAPRMADRFAAVNMSSGHPNGVDFTNMRNLPIQLQVGEFDTAYNRNVEAVNYDDILNDLQNDLEGYEHRTLIHYGMGHNFTDWDKNPVAVMSDPQAWRDEGNRKTKKVDPFPPDYMTQFTRNPIPDLVIWNLSTRAEKRSVESFYYLRAEKTVTDGVIVAQYFPGENVVYIDAYDVDGDFSILLNEDMIDFTRPVDFYVDDELLSLNVKPDLELIEKTTAERGDPNYQFEAELYYSQLKKMLEEN